MSNLFVKVFRDKVEEILPVTFSLSDLSADQDGYALTLTAETNGSFTVSPMPAPAGFSGSWNDLADKPTLFSGNYDDLANLPTLFDGSYNSLSDLPSLASIAFTGEWADIENKPALIELSGTPQDGDIAVYDATANNNAGGWTLRREAAGELEKIEVLTIQTNRGSFDFGDGPMATASTILVTTSLNQAEVEFLIQGSSVAEGRTFRLHFFGDAPSIVQGIKVSVSGTINGENHYVMKRHQTIELLCISRVNNKFIIL